jgi:hypothetical protein
LIEEGSPHTGSDPHQGDPGIIVRPRYLLGDTPATPET